MRRFRLLPAALVCGLAMTAAAHAADPPGTWLPEFKKPFYTDLISGWYARGDVGYRWNSIGSVDTPLPVTSWTFDNAWSLGGGAGYKYKWFRSDVTIDYSERSDFRGNIAAVNNFYNDRIDAWTLLWNVYLDMGTWGGFTPYIGAGAGASYLRTAQFTQPIWENVQDGRNWNFSWAAIGGVSYQFSPNLLLDLSYRYLSLGETVTGMLPPTYTSRVTYRDMSAQEIRIGLRWMLD